MPCVAVTSYGVRHKFRGAFFMKRGLLAFLLAFIIYQAPWRLSALVLETLVMPTGYTRLVDGDSRYWDAQDLEYRLEKMGWSIVYQDDMAASRNLLGLMVPATRQIFIESSLHWNAKYTVLAHEGAHTLQPGRLTTNQAEAFAEAVATLVSGDSLREHARYLAGVKADLIPVVLVQWREIYRAADLLENR